MEKENEPLRVTTYGNPPGLNVETFFRRDFQVLAMVVITPFFILGADSVPMFARLLSFLICWGAVGFYIRWNTKTHRPMAFEADRTGFRIKGGRLRHWNTFLGVSVERHVVKARAERQANNVRAVSIWERLGFLVGRY
ncbi:hypothetical protein [Octadecabacter ascidiaceicola]|nr:hypothetical protein [Octadecabacter ascidiaceicola]